jgi:hypothetical protein
MESTPVFAAALSRLLIAGPERHDHIFTAFVATSRFIKHSVGLSDTRSVTKKNFEACTPALVLFGLHLLAEPLRIRLLSCCGSVCVFMMLCVGVEAADGNR